MFLNGILPDALMAPEQPLQHWASTGHLGHNLTFVLEKDQAPSLHHS